MPDKCATEHCDGLTRLEQEVVDLKKQNGNDHKQFREQISAIEKENVRQTERYDRIMDNLTEMRNDTKESFANLNKSVSPILNKFDNFEELTKDVNELKAKPGKRWDGIVDKIIIVIATAVVSFLLGKAGIV